MGKTWACTFLFLLVAIAASAGTGGTVVVQDILVRGYGLGAEDAARIAVAASALEPAVGRIDRVMLERLLADCRAGGVSPDQLPRMLAAWGRYRERLLAVGEAPVRVRHEVRMVTRAVLAERDRTPPAERLERMIGRRLGKHAVLEDDRSAVNKKDKDKEKYKNDGGYGGSRGKKPKKND